MIEYPTIPETITVHLGSPDSDAQNVTLSFQDYIKNVASSEIYPTWPEEALRANIIAQISVALNRVYTEFYRSRGKDFDITSSPAYDQTFVYQRDIFDNISEIVDEIFTTYIKRSGNIEPLFAQFCDGVRVQCSGLSQWGSVTLADDGLNYTDILRNYYGDDIDLVFDAPIESPSQSAPPVSLREGDTGRDVQLIQRRLNRISGNFPAIPKIYPQDGFFDKSTSDAVRKFQEVFSLTPDGVVGRATWYKIQTIYNAVKRLDSLNSEGLRLDELSSVFTEELKVGDSSAGVMILQYYLGLISLYYPTVSATAVDGDYGPETRNAVISFERTFGLPETGVVNRALWNMIEDTYNSIIESIPFKYREGVALPFPGRVLRLGLEGDDVLTLQEYLNFIGETYQQIPRVTVDGVFGAATERAVRAFVELFDIPSANSGRVTANVWRTLIDVYTDLYYGTRVEDGQFPGWIIR